jgi:hypothetical protein
MASDKGVVADILPRQTRTVACGKCPFCQSTSVQGCRLCDQEGNPVDEFQLECMLCGATGPRGVSLAEATRRWNQRF